MTTILLTTTGVLMLLFVITGHYFLRIPNESARLYGRVQFALAFLYLMLTSRNVHQYYIHYEVPVVDGIIELVGRAAVLYFSMDWWFRKDGPKEG